MTISSKIIADSVGHLGKRIITFQNRYPRFVHAEFLTHRQARNASSSRAIPAKKFIEWALKDPAFFERVYYNEKGMQGRQLLSEEDLQQFYKEWLELRDITIGFVERWVDPKGLNIHKQHANRVLEPWHHIEVVYTASQADIDNLYQLRDHTFAQPEMEVLAKAMKEAQLHSVPRVLKPGQWHLPYIHDEERATNTSFSLALWSAARCARVSYMNHEGKLTTPEEDESLFERLIMTDPDPMHMSPTEHQACMANDPRTESRALSGCLDSSWIQFRKVIERVRSIPQTIRLEHARQAINNPYLIV